VEELSMKEQRKAENRKYNYRYTLILEPINQQEDIVPEPYPKKENTIYIDKIAVVPKIFRCSPSTSYSNHLTIGLCNCKKIGNLSLLVIKEKDQALFTCNGRDCTSKIIKIESWEK